MLHLSVLHSQAPASSPNSFLSFIPTTMLLTRDLAEEQNSVHVVVRRGRRKAEGLVCVNMIQFTGSNINNQINSFQRVYQCMQICESWLLITIHFRGFCVNNELVVGGFCNTNKHVSQRTRHRSRQPAAGFEGVITSHDPNAFFIIKKTLLLFKKNPSYFVAKICLLSNTA